MADFGRTGVIKDPASHDLKRFGLDFITNYEFAVDIATLPLLVEHLDLYLSSSTKSSR